MGRFLLLLVFLSWMSFPWQPPASPPPFSPHDLIHPGIFLGGYVLLVLAAAVWNRRMARGVAGDNMSRQLRRFNRLMSFARSAVLIWFITGLYLLGWGNLVSTFLWRLGLQPGRCDTPGLLVGCLPAFCAWMALWWAQYPADICFREQGMLAQLDAGFPIHRPPSLASYLAVNLRLQLFFTYVPILVLVFLRDLISLGLRPLGIDEEKSTAIQLVISLVTAAIVLVFAPELLRRVLRTEPMPQGPLRQKLESICKRHNVRYRDVLLWRTDHNMGNAAVMGLIPQVRYILMSDLLLETMTDEQIEAVFAHEVGHVIYRHMLWLAIFIGTAMLWMVGIAGTIGDSWDRWLGTAAWSSTAEIADIADVAGGLLGTLGLFALFLFLSRKFERQADVFAARTLEHEGSLNESHIGSYGAGVFSSALEQVARVNCIPTTAWSWCHGSIAHRIDYLQHASASPDRTRRFDRFMARLYGVLILSLFGSGVCAITALVMQRGGG